MERKADIHRKTNETDIHLKLDLDGSGQSDITTGIGFFDHMLTLFIMHGFFDMTIRAKGDLDVDLHHTVEDVGIVLGDAFMQAMGDRKGINRFGQAATPMDETLAEVTVDLSNRPYLIYNLPTIDHFGQNFNSGLAREFFRAFAVKAGLNLHINLRYGDDPHHILEAIFKAWGRAMDQALAYDDRIKNVRSSKGII